MRCGGPSVRRIVVERSGPLRDLLVGPPLLGHSLQVVGPTALLGEVALLEPVPAFADRGIVHGRGLAALLAVEEMDHGHGTASYPGQVNTVASPASIPRW